MSSSRCLVIAASPTEENYRLVSRNLIGKMQRGTLVVVVSRAHLVDFEALIEAAQDLIEVAGSVRLKDPSEPRRAGGVGGPVPARPATPGSTTPLP